MANKKYKNKSYEKITNIIVRSKKKGYKIPTKKEREQLKKIMDQPCHYCGTTEMVRLDRIDNSVGYVPSNCLPCCGTCNVVRGHKFTIEETEVMIKAVLEFRKNQK